MEEAERLGLSSTTSETTRMTTTTSTPTSTKTTATTTTTTTTTTKRPISSTKPTLTTSKAKQAHKFDEDDYNFLSERLPDLSDDEYANLSEDANPLHFLKQQPKPQIKEQVKIKLKFIYMVMASMKSGSPIYITIPIYISTAGKLPLTLTIGDQEMPIHQLRRAGNTTSKKNPSTKAPNSHFNRLLQQIESPKRRVTNRHRHSPTKSKIYAIKERHNN
ncbi:uncharacterized protein [Drosophila tropicalis]|uniref:uncharacterized protein n=1 Tax=Drosophila tropicalis TaxID=46794 RepID=UPI0035ABF15E